MLLVDSSAWIGHLRERDSVIENAIRAGELCTHEFVITELALGSLPNRHQFLANLRRFNRLETSSFEATLAFVEDEGLHSTGVGFVDASLLASAAASTSMLWTRDKKLAAQAERLGLAFNPH